jgi:hypothetical protein
MSHFKKATSLFILITLVFSVFWILPVKISAAAVAMSVSSPSNGEFNALTATDVTFGWTASAEYTASSDTITITVSPTLAGALTNCTSATTDIDGDSTSDGSFGSFTTSGAVYTVSGNNTTQASSAGVDMCLKFAASTIAGNYSISMSDTNGDYGSVLVYVGNDNDVTVTAQVTPSLAFSIRNSADTTDTNTCDLGVLSLTAVSTCAYRLKVATNAGSGYTVQINSDGDLRKSGSGDVSDDLDLDPITENSTVASGTENYGIAFTGGACTGGSVTEAGDFSDDDTPIPISSATNLYSCNGPNNPTSTDTTNTALVTHRAAMDAATETGNYSQVVTYYVSATF